MMRMEIEKVIKQSTSKEGVDDDKNGKILNIIMIVENAYSVESPSDDYVSYLRDTIKSHTVPTCMQEVSFHIFWKFVVIFATYVFLNPDIPSGLQEWLSSDEDIFCMQILSLFMYRMPSWFLYLFPLTWSI